MSNCVGPFDNGFSATFTAIVRKPFEESTFTGVTTLSHIWVIPVYDGDTSNNICEPDGEDRRQKERAVPQQRNWNIGELTISREPQGLNFIARVSGYRLLRAMPAEMSRRWERILDSRSSDLLFAESPRALLKATEVGLAPGTRECLGKGGEGVTAAQRVTYLEDLLLSKGMHKN